MILLCGVLGSILGNESYGYVYSMDSKEIATLRSGREVALYKDKTISDYSENSIKMRLNEKMALRFSSIDDAISHLDIWKLSDCLKIDEDIIKVLWLDDFDTLMKMSVYDGFLNRSFTTKGILRDLVGENLPCLAALLGSVNCWNSLSSQPWVEYTNMLSACALLGGNLEIISIINQNRGGLFSGNLMQDKPAWRTAFIGVEMRKDVAEWVKIMVSCLKVFRNRRSFGVKI